MWGVVNGEGVCWLMIVVIMCGYGLSCWDGLLFLCVCVDYIRGM